MKAAILLALHNKNESLPNVLTSIEMQRSRFPFEVCIIDDCSVISPKPIIDTLCPEAKFHRLKKNLGFRNAKNECLKLVSDDVNTLVLMNADVMFLQEQDLQNLCERVSRKKVCFAEVANVKVDPDAYKNFEHARRGILEMWTDLLNGPQGSARNNTNVFQVGRMNRRAWLFFLGAISRDDLESIEYRENSCDAVLAPKMKKAGFSAEILAYVKACHQKHAKTRFDCSIESSCNFYCRRTKNRKHVPLVSTYPNVRASVLFAKPEKAQ